LAHAAELDENNVVVRVLVIADAQEDRAQDFLANELGLGGRWVTTSYNTAGGAHLLGGTPKRFNFAGVGYKYDAAKDAFIPPKPFASWTLNATSCLWEAPTPMPVVEGKFYEWDETSISWKEVTE